MVINFYYLIKKIYFFDFAFFVFAFFDFAFFDFALFDLFGFNFLPPLETPGILPLAFCGGPKLSNSFSASLADFFLSSRSSFRLVASISSGCANSSFISSILACIVGSILPLPFGSERIDVSCLSSLSKLSFFDCFFAASSSVKRIFASFSALLVFVTLLSCAGGAGGGGAGGGLAGGGLAGGGLAGGGGAGAGGAGGGLAGGGAGAGGAGAGGAGAGGAGAGGAGADIAAATALAAIDA